MENFEEYLESKRQEVDTKYAAGELSENNKKRLYSLIDKLKDKQFLKVDDESVARKYLADYLRLELMDSIIQEVMQKIKAKYGNNVPLDATFDGFNLECEIRELREKHGFDI